MDLYRVETEPVALATRNIAQVSSLLETRMENYLEPVDFLLDG